MYQNYPTYPYPRNTLDHVEKRNKIKVSGEGNVTAVPNQASATIGVITEGKNLTETQQQNSETINKIINALLSLNVPQKNLQTFDYQVTTEYDYVDGKQIFRGYRVTNLLKIVIDSVNDLGVIINRVIEAGANYVSNVRFEVANPMAFYLQALTNALRNAHEKAETIVKQLKVNLVSTPILVEEISKEAGPILPQLAFVKGASTEQFQPGTLQFTANVRVVYEYSR
jgi:uncharacterized protein